MFNKRHRIVYAACFTAAAFMMIPVTAQTQRDARQSGPIQLHRLDVTAGADVLNREGETIGTIKDVAIDLREGQIAFAIVDMTMETAREFDRFALPWRALLPADRDFTLYQNDARYFDNRNGFNEDQLPNFGDRDWSESVHRRFDVTPYWRVHEYLDSIRVTGSGGWDADDRYGRRLDTQRLTDLDGTIKEITNVQPLSGMSAGIGLVVRTDQGERNVHLGPRWYLDRRDLGIGEGDRIEIKAAEAEFDEETVYIATSLTHDGERIELRDEDTGEPVWGESLKDRRVTDGNRPSDRIERMNELREERRDDRRTDEDETERRNQPRQERRAAASPSQDVVLGSDLLGMRVESRRHEQLGEVENVVYNRDGGQIAYVIVDSDDDRLTAAPWNSVELDRVDRNKITLNVSTEQYRRAETFRSDRYPVLNSIAFVRQNHRQFGVEPNYQSYKLAKARQQPERHLEAHEQVEFSPETEKAFEGRIVDIKRAVPHPGMEESVSVVIDGEQGRRQVFLGPAWFIDHQDFDLRRGDHIRVNGWVLKEDRQMTGVITSLLAVGDIRVRLRSVDGYPRWDAVIQGSRNDE